MSVELWTAVAVLTTSLIEMTMLVTVLRQLAKSDKREQRLEEEHHSMMASLRGLRSS